MKFRMTVIHGGLAALLCACAADTSTVSRLDSGGLTVVTEPEAIVFTKPVTSMTGNVRDYVYLGPVELNRMGERSYFLWIGMASTVDPEMWEPAKDAASIVLLVNGEPMALATEHWPTRLDRPPYETDAPLMAALSAQTSISQLNRIADARSLELWFPDSTGTDDRYVPWAGKWQDWRGFTPR